MVECPVCGHKSSEDSSFCASCGARLGEAETRRASDTIRDMARELERAVREQPEDTDARYQLALALMYEEEWGRAAENLMEVVERDPNFADAHANLAVCLGRLGQVDRAAQAIDGALALAPDRRRYQRLRKQIAALRRSGQ